MAAPALGNILLSTVVPIADPQRYKVHLACWNGSNQPLDVFVNDKDEWDNWNRWRSKKDDFNREFILALIDFYPEKDRWLFGGIYRVLSRGGVNDSHSYRVELANEGRPLIGRLKLALKRPSRAKAMKLEKLYTSLVVSEILAAPYTGEAFLGYDQLHVPFSMLETIINTQRLDWKGALQSVKGVYLLSDTSNGKLYVGSAYGEEGVWARWTSYVQTGHGNNDLLSKVIAQHGVQYAREHFKLALLEHHPMRTDDNYVIKREQYWKDVLLSRGELGYNKN
jgi:hypothetical protein